MNKFYSENEYKEFLNLNQAMIYPIQALSDSIVSFHYMSKSGGMYILYFDRSKKFGEVFHFDFIDEKVRIPKEVFMKEIAIEMQVPEITRQNYIELHQYLSRDRELIFDEQISRLGELDVLDEPNIEDWVSDSNLELLSSELNKFSKEELIDYEIPIMTLFWRYAVVEYSNSEVIELHKNIFGVSFDMIILKCKEGRTTNLSDHIFGVLFPDGDDEFEDDGLDLLRIKKWIDYMNSDNYIRVN